MKGTDHFKRTIQMYLEQRAEEDTLFAKNYRNPAKNIDDCVTYILNYVQKSGCNGFTDGTMPPLRDCPEDIMPLAEFFREMANRELEREVKGFAASARNALLAHAWPGNVRELKQKIQTAVLQSEGDMITEADLELDNEPSATSACFTLKSGDEERGRILRALKQAAGNKKMAAKILGIGRTTLYNKLVEYGLNEEN